MSRVGKNPVKIPAGVQTAVKDGMVSVQGPAGKLELQLGAGISVAVANGEAVVTRSSDDSQTRANHGSTRAILANMMLGASKGWKRSLEMTGVGYNASVSGQKLKLNCGYSHEVNIELPKEVKAKVEKTTIHLESPDRQLLGNIAAKIRRVRPPEPYLGKGIRFTEEKIRRKAGKAGKK